jgi:Mg-chelatase subunit ChlI
MSYAEEMLRRNALQDAVYQLETRIDAIKRRIQLSNEPKAIMQIREHADYLNQDALELMELCDAITADEVEQKNAVADCMHCVVNHGYHWADNPGSRFDCAKCAELHQRH